MPTKPALAPPQGWRHDLRWQIGGLVFAVLVLVGAGCTAWALHLLSQRGTQHAQNDAQELAQSVAHTVAQQLEQSLRLGTPLSQQTQQPGLATSWHALVQHHPALNYIALEHPPGTLLHAAGQPQGNAATPVRLPLMAAAPAQGAVVVVQADARAGMRHSVQQAATLSAALVLAVALAAALLVANGPAAQWQAQRCQLLARLQSNTPTPPETQLPPLGPAPPHGLAALAHAVAAGDAQWHAARQAVHRYGQELLALDFDDQQRPQIQAILTQALDEGGPEAKMPNGGQRHHPAPSA